jgi:hypothetical protein
MEVGRFGEIEGRGRMLKMDLVDHVDFPFVLWEHSKVRWSGSLICKAEKGEV